MRPICGLIRVRILLVYRIARANEAAYRPHSSLSLSLSLSLCIYIYIYIYQVARAEEAAQLTYADVCYMLTYADVYIAIYGRMLTYAIY